MRVALVSPYSWTLPGGVTRHVAGLAEALGARGHEVRVLAPGAGADPPPWLVDLGPTVGLPFNGARSNLALAPGARGRVLDALRAFGPDVVHLHEPVAPWPCWTALGFADAPLVGTFHTYGTSRLTHGVAALAGSQVRMRRLAVRIAVSEAAAWTARSFYGGEYRIVPNGVHLPALPAVEGGGADGALRVVFVGRREPRKGLDVLLRAVDALDGVVPVALTVVGADRPASEAEKAAALAAADVLVAPARGGESFGMVLTEGFAAGLPVVCSAIPGYRDVARHGVEGLHVPPGDPAALAEALRELALDRALLARLARGASARAAAFAWPVVAEQVEAAYADALATAATTPTGRQSTSRRQGDERSTPAGVVVPSMGPAWVPAAVRDRRLPAPLALLEPPVPRRARAGRAARRAGTAAGGAAVVAGAVVALHHVGADAVAADVARSSPGPTLAALAVMALSLLLRAVAWRALLAAALPGRAVRLADAYRATAIGVLMSATLPARLGEPARALLLTRRLGARQSGSRRPGDAGPTAAGARGTLPVVVGTMVGQTLLNLVALVLLAAVVLLGAAGPWRDGATAVAAVGAPLLALAAVVALAPRVARRLPAGRAARRLQAATIRVRTGLRPLATPRTAAVALLAQLLAWTLQWLGCRLLLGALGLEVADPAAAAAGVLLAVNVTAVVPVTPSNVGVFQAACVAVLVAHGAPAGDALAYGVVLQAVELATAVGLGVGALVREGVSWRQVRADAVRGRPVPLRPRTP